MRGSFTFVSKYSDFIWILLIATCAFFITQFNFASRIQHTIDASHAAYSQIPATGQFVFIGIDKKSMDQIGVWPWPRSIHAQVIDKLTDAGVRDIGIDIDFSAASTPAEDEKLARSLERAGGGVILATFAQDGSASRKDNAIAVNRPLDMFADQAWMGTVNVITDKDGIVRHFPMGEFIGDEFVPSLPSFLAGVLEETREQIGLNFSISPDTIPTYSVSELLNGKIGAEELKGKSVIYGAQAVELRDNFLVPVHGILPGAVIQLVAAETLAQNISIRSIDQGMPFYVVVGIVLLAWWLLGRKARRSSLLNKLSIFMAIAAIAEAIAFYLFKEHSLILPTVSIGFFLFIVAGYAAFKEIDIQRLLLAFAATKTQNMQRVLHQVIEDNVSAILVLDEAGNAMEVNQQAKAYFGASLASGSNVLASGGLPVLIEADLISAIDLLKNHGDATPLIGRAELRTSDNQTRVLEYSITASHLLEMSGRRKGAQENEIVACLTASDITVRLEQEKRLAHVATHSFISGALRRTELVKRFDSYLESEDSVYGYTIFAMNLHRFKAITDALGRNVGNKILEATVQRIETMGSEVRDIASLGGDGFAFWFASELTNDEIQTISKWLIDAISEPYHVGHSALNVGLRIGVVSSAVTSVNQAERLVSNAEVALDEASKNGSGSMTVFEPSFAEKRDYARAVENHLWNAVTNDELRVFYQPQVDLKTEQIVGVEALVRWQSPDLGFVSPVDFIEIAEANGVIDQIGPWILNKACEDALLMPDHITVAVNVSPIQFTRSDVFAQVESALARTGLPPHRLHIEITEAGFLEKTPEVMAALDKLNAMNICLALDDFGTGFSSLGYFVDFPISKIKVDQMFVRTLEPNSNHEAIIRSVKTLSDGLDLKMICEGIETEEQLAILRNIGVHEGQGFLFSKPQPLEIILGLMAEPKKLRA